jgi:hypothetical protein
MWGGERWQLPTPYHCDNIITIGGAASTSGLSWWERPRLRGLVE